MDPSPETEAQGQEPDDSGFTLVELMVVVMVLALLIGIVVPSFIGARERAQDRAAQSNLRNALTAAKVAFTDTGDYSQAHATDLAMVEPGLVFIEVDGSGYLVPSRADHEIAVWVGGSSTTVGNNYKWAAAALSDSRTCWYIRDILFEDGTSVPAGTTYGKGSWDECDGLYANDLIPHGEQSRTWPQSGN